MYGNGRGVPKDNLLAYMWWNIAGANGQDVEENMGILTYLMSQADISKAQEKTTQYIKDNPSVYWPTIAVFLPFLGCMRLAQILSMTTIDHSKYQHDAVD